MLKRYWAFLLIVITFTACSSVPQGKKHMMWEVRTPNSTVFLVGSIHIADSSLYPLDNIYYEKLDSSKIFVTEVNMDDVDPSSVLKLVQLRNGKTLKDMVPADIYKILSERLEKMGLPEMVYNTFKPGYALMMAQIMGDNEESKDFSSMAEGIDMHLAARASDKSKIGLEEIGTQMAILEKVIDVDPKKMRQYLNAEQNSENMSDLKSLIEAWKNADTDKIVKVIEESAEMDDESEKLMNELLRDRNINMANKINSYLVDGGTFYVVVGAGHLCGDKSIIELLEDMGYTVNQL